MSLCLFVRRLLFGCRLTTLSAGVFGGLSLLSTLDISMNVIATLPVGIFAGLTSLSNLYLYSNNINAIPPFGSDILGSIKNLFVAYL